MKNNDDSSVVLSQAELDFLLSPAAIRDRAEKIHASCLAGKTHFEFHAENWRAAVETVLETIREKYPSLKIPFHSRWGHFRAGSDARLEAFQELISEFDPLERARIKLDLVITSVLLDAGSGPGWKYREPFSDQIYDRSEGLGVASFHWFLTNAFNSDGKNLKADANGLRAVNEEALMHAFQVSRDNPLLGVEGRVKLLNNLGDAVEKATANGRRIFKDGRPGNLLDELRLRHGDIIPAEGILRVVLDGLGSIWPGRISAKIEGFENSVNLGDVWRYSPFANGTNASDALVAIHKLSQWMTYSLIEPIEEAGLVVTGVENLTGLAEYRNGGLFLDSGVLKLRNADDVEKEWTPDSDFIIEWRALTVALLDRMGAEVQQALGKNAAEFPLAKVLEGGTWWAGRKLAAKAREGGGPPLKILSDGTVF